MKSSDETIKHPIPNSMKIDLNVLGALMEGKIICEEDNNIIVTKH